MDPRTNSKLDLGAGLQAIRQRRESASAQESKFQHRTLDGHSTPAERSALTSEIGSRVAAKQGVAVSLKADENAKSRVVDVHHVDDHQVWYKEDGASQVQTMPRAEFERQLRGATLDKTDAPAPAEGDPSGINLVSKQPGLRPNTETPLTTAAAKAALPSLDAQAERTLGSLPREDRQTFKDLRDGLGDPVAKAALDTWLASGRLTSDPGMTKPDMKGNSLVQSLSQMANTPMEPPLDANKLVAQTIREIDDPSAISQRRYGTCAAATTQIAAAKTDAAEYARLLTGLGSADKGAVITRDGEGILVRKEGTEKPQPDKYGDMDDRSDTSRLFQSAAMQFALGKGFYDVHDDKKYNLETNEKGRLAGLTDGQVADLSKALEGQAQDVLDTGSQREHVAEITKRLQAAASSGQAAKAALFWQTGTHEVLVDHIDDHQVTFTNPHGEVDTMTREEFERRLDGAVVPKR